MLLHLKLFFFRHVHVPLSETNRLFLPGLVTRRCFSNTKQIEIQFKLTRDLHNHYIRHSFPPHMNKDSHKTIPCLEKQYLHCLLESTIISYSNTHPSKTSLLHTSHINTHLTTTRLSRQPPSALGPTVAA